MDLYMSFARSCTRLWPVLPKLNLGCSFSVTAFEELLMTMTMAQKISKSGWIDPSDNWGQDGGYDMPKVQQTGQKQGEMGNLGLQKVELPKLLHIVS